MPVRPDEPPSPEEASPEEVSPEEARAPDSRLARLGWFVLIWALSLGTVLALSYGLRWLIFAG